MLLVHGGTPRRLTRGLPIAPPPQRLATAAVRLHMHMHMETQPLAEVAGVLCHWRSPTCCGRSSRTATWQAQRILRLSSRLLHTWTRLSILCTCGVCCGIMCMPRLSWIGIGGGGGRRLGGVGSHKDRARRIVARYGPFDPDRESLLMEDEHGMEDCDQAELLDDLAFMVSGCVVVVCCVAVCVCVWLCVRLWLWLWLWLL